jgi:hypothetical protein
MINENGVARAFAEDLALMQAQVLQELRAFHDTPEICTRKDKGISSKNSADFGFGDA